jgi:ATP-dependent Clp protease ATP-binding subunit ClpX
MASKGAKDESTLYCSFCGKSQHEVKKLIAGPTVFICNECTEVCMDLVHEARESRSWIFQGEKADLDKIHSTLDGTVPGPGHAKSILAKLLYKRAKYLVDKDNGFDPRTRPTLVLLRGSGLGRAEFVLKLSRLPIGPLSAVDAFQSGSIGSVEDIRREILQGLFEKAGQSKPIAESGIVCIDDLDWIFPGPEHSGDGNNTFRANLSETLVEISGRAQSDLWSDKKGGRNPVINLRGMTFVLGGTFRCLDDVSKAPLAPPPTEKPTAKVDQNPPSLAEAQAKALIDYGLDPRLVERIETVIDLNDA